MKTGQTYGRFEVIELLQKGGMGEVYRARDVESSEYVALKLLAPEYQNNEYVAGRFMAEIDVCRRLSHPNIVRYIDSGKLDQCLFLALEHIEGINLAQLIEREGALDIDLALSIMQDVTYAVNFAHGKDIIHRDLKPHNVMVTRQGVIKLIDFGVAHARNDYVNTEAGMVLGSLCYNSPEQNQGKLVDVRSDIYSLGLVFYELVTGKRVLPNTSVADIILSQVELDQTMVPPRFHNEEIPEALQAVILKMARFDPKERYQKVEPVLLALKALAAERQQSVSAESAQSKILADRDLADSHYWKGMNHLSEGKYLEALEEFEALLNLSLFHHQAYVAQVEEQVNFLSWTLDLCAEGSVSEDEEIRNVELDVLKQLSSVYTQDKNNGIRKAMQSLLGFYRERVTEIRQKRKQQEKEHKVPIAPEQYPVVVQKLAAIYAKLGRVEQQRLMMTKIFAVLGKLGDPAKAREILAGLRKDYPDDDGLRQGYAAWLFRHGTPAEALQEALNLGRHYREHDQLGRSLAQYKLILQRDPVNQEATAAIQGIHEALEEVSQETERLIALTQTMLQVQDYNAAINMCLKFLNDYPDNLVVLGKLADLYAAKGQPQKAKDQLVRMGVLSFDHGDHEQARGIFGRALKLEPDCQEAINYLVELFKREDPAFCNKSSSKAIVEELYLRLGMYDKVIANCRKKLKGTAADLAVFDKILELMGKAGDQTGLLAVNVDKVVCAVQHAEEATALAEMDRFMASYPEEPTLPVRLKALPFETKVRIRDPRLRRYLD